MTIGILGGGLTGCALGRLFKDRGWSFEILEAEPRIGGLLRSAEVNGYTFDIGGPHILFSKNKPALDFLLDAIKGNITTKRRNAKVLFKGRFVKYPFENGLASLPFLDNMACLTGFTGAAISRRIIRNRKANNLREWCRMTFGGGISRRYLIPYNEKIWKFPLEEIATGWVERIPNPSWKDVFKSSLGVDTEGYTHQLNFHYPLTGGIESLISGLTRDFQDRIVLNYRVKSVKKCDAKWVVSDGTRERSYDAIVSTIPLPDLVEAADLPLDARGAGRALHVNSIIGVCLGGVMAKRTDLSWLYVPSNAALAHRVSFLSNSSEKAAPPGKCSFIADITCKYDDEVWRLSDQALIERTVSDLTREGVLLGSDYEASLVTRARYAYVIDDLARQKNLTVIRNRLDELGMLICGRFAEFEYLNMDAIAARALAFVAKHEETLSKAA